MKIVIHTDEDGFKTAYKLRDNDSEKNAKQGIPVGPPDLRKINWENIVRELNNYLVDSGLLTWDDVMKSQNGITVALNAVIRNKIVNLYKEGVNTQ